MRVLVFLAFVAAIVFVVRWLYMKVQTRRTEHRRRTGRWLVDEESDGEFLNIYTVRNLHTSYEERALVAGIPHGASDFDDRLYLARSRAFERATALNTGRNLTR